MKLLLSCVACLTALIAGAQPFPTVFSERFESPDGQHFRIFRAANGNTIVVQTPEKQPLTIQIYDQAHKKIAEEKIQSSQIDLSGRQLRDVPLLSTGNDLVYITSGWDDKKLGSVYRFIISAESGKLVREDKLFDQTPTPVGRGHIVVPTPEGMPDAHQINVAVDPKTGNYAVSMNDPFATTPGRQIELHLFGSDHKELSHHYLADYDTRFKCLALMDMFMADGKVYVASCAFNPKNAGGPPLVLLSQYTSNGFENHELTLKGLSARPQFDMHMNPKSGLIESLITFRSGGSGQNLMGTSKVFYSVAHAYINPSDFSVVSVKSLEIGRLTAYAKSHYNSKGDYGGTPVDLLLNADGSSTITLTERTYVSGGYGGDRERLGGIGVLNYDEKGNLLAAYVEPRECNTVHDYGFYGFDFIGSAKGHYIVMNDHPRNLHMKEVKLGGILTRTEDAQASCFRLTPKVVGRDYFLGEPDDAFDNRFVNFNISAFAPDYSECVYLIHEKAGRKDRSCRIAWVSMK